jgi:hypothetical protein
VKPTNDKRICAVHKTNDKQDVMAHSVNDSCHGGAPDINQNNSRNYLEAAGEMSKQQTINGAESRHKTHILLISCHLHCTLT